MNKLPSSLFFLILTSLCLFSALNESEAKEIKVGVYYYPGWRDNMVGGAYPLPWEKIKPYPEREPLLGWYKEGYTSVAEKQIQWMKQYGIDYVVFDSYFTNAGETQLSHAVKAFLRAPSSDQLEFAILWANHSPKIPSDKAAFGRIVRFWIRNYFSQENYMRIDDKPVVFIFSSEGLETTLNGISATTQEFFDYAQQVAIRAGYKGIYFVAGAWPGKSALSMANGTAYSAYSGYNYHAGVSAAKVVPYSHSYSELTAGYSFTWNWFGQYINKPYIVPVTSGWDKRPWGGTAGDPLHDNSYGSPAEFESHLQDAKNLIERGGKNMMNNVIICCWNEYGEGSYIEPTKQYQMQYLEAINRVFNQ